MMMMMMMMMMGRCCCCCCCFPAFPRLYGRPADDVTSFLAGRRLTGPGSGWLLGAWLAPWGGREGGLPAGLSVAMVFYFTSSVAATPYTIYMGKDKYENEDLIKYGWPEDIWFHVDKLSSAHVYLRLHEGQTVDDVPKEVLIDCAHLVKANSIQGCKMNNVNVVYTPWANLKKTADMDVGQIGFHRQKDVKVLTVEKKVNEVLNRLEKTKVERFPDLAAEKESRDREERNEKKAQIQEMKRKEKEESKKKKEMEELRSYSSLMKTENMTSNQDGNDSDDFM